LIAKWYLGDPLTNSRMTKWSMDDMSLRKEIFFGTTRRFLVQIF